MIREFFAALLPKRRPRPACLDCKWRELPTGMPQEFAECRPAGYRLCILERIDGLCGPEGRFWEEKS